MRGRDKFQRFRPVLAVFERAVAYVPYGVVRSLLPVVRPIPGNVGVALRWVLLRRICRACGDVVAAFEDVYFRRPENLSIGDHVSIHPMSYIDASGGITIRNNVSIAHAVTIMSTEHGFGSGSTFIRDNDVKSSPVMIDDNVWIASGCRILAGVTIGTNVVVGAGAVVTSDLPPNSVAVGVPARVIKSIPAVE